MAINKYMRAVLRALSYSELDVSRHYLLVREATRVTHLPLSPTYKTVPYEVQNGEHTVPCRLFTPRGELEALPVILFAHGGGWVTGDIESYSRVCQNMAEKLNQMVLSVDYRLAPEFPFPAGINDYYAVARALFAGELLPVDPADITVMGDSAGGNLTAALSLRARNEGLFLPRRQILLYPACAGNHNPDLSPYRSLRDNGEDFLLTTKRVREYMELYCADEKDRQNPYFAPLCAQTLTHQPDTLIVTAEYCPLRDEGEAYGARLAADGNRVTVRRIPDALHGFFSLPVKFPHVQTCYRHIEDFLRGTQAEVTR